MEGHKDNQWLKPPLRSAAGGVGRDPQAAVPSELGPQPPGPAQRDESRPVVMGRVLRLEGHPAAGTLAALLELGPEVRAALLALAQLPALRQGLIDAVRDGWPGAAKLPVDAQRIASAARAAEAGRA